MNDNSIFIGKIAVKIKAPDRASADKLMTATSLSADHIKKLLTQAAEKIRAEINIHENKAVLNLGTLSLTSFDSAFSEKLITRFAEFLIQANREPPEESLLPGEHPAPAEWLTTLGQSSSALDPLARCCLQPAALQQLIHSPQPAQLKNLLQLLLARAWSPSASLAAPVYRRVTSSRLSMAALGYLLQSSQGKRWLSVHYPDIRMLALWGDAVASGEIEHAQVAQLFFNLQSALPHAVITRWLAPLWQRKPVRNAVRQQTDSATAQTIAQQLNRPAQQKDEPPEYTLPHAGIVLLWPLLPQLFSLLGLLSDEQFNSDEARWQAALALDGLICPDHAPDSERLHICRLLCGIAPDAPLPALIPPDDQQQQQMESWLMAIAQQLPGFHQLGLEDIRQLFLQRPGTVNENTTPPQLLIKPEPYDLLLNDWPWPLTLAYLPWLEHHLPIIWPIAGLTG